MAVGACACSGGIFARAYNVQGGIDRVVPVDVYVPGCAARPERVIDGVVQGIAALEGKRAAMAAGRRRGAVRPQSGSQPAGAA